MNVFENEENMCYTGLNLKFVHSKKIRSAKMSEYLARKSIGKRCLTAHALD
jgi:hypothetical protein